MLSVHTCSARNQNKIDFYVAYIFCFTSLLLSMSATVKDVLNELSLLPASAGSAWFGGTMVEYSFSNGASIKIFYEYACSSMVIGRAEAERDNQTTHIFDNLGDSGYEILKIMPEDISNHIDTILNTRQSLMNSWKQRI